MSAPRRNAPTQFDLGALDARVDGLQTNIDQLGKNTSDAIHSLANQITSLAAKLDARGQIPWPALSLMLSVITVVGGLVWYPIKESQARLEQMVTVIGEKYVTAKEFDFRFTSNSARREDWQRMSEERFKRLERETDALDKRLREGVGK